MKFAQFIIIYTMLYWACQDTGMYYVYTISNIHIYVVVYTTPSMDRN